MTKALFFDIDGTLVSFETHRIPFSTIEALEAAHAKGLKIFIATGRPKAIINNLSELQDRNLIDGYITMNGAYCFVGEQVIYKSAIPQEEVKAMAAFCEKKGVPCIFVEEHHISVCQPDDMVKKIFYDFLHVNVIPTVSFEEATSKEIIQMTPFITEEEEIRSLIKPRKRFAHKGTFGHALLIAGSYGMAGASILSARACLRSGVGLLTVHVPIHNHDLLQTTVPEAIVQTDIHDHYFAEPVDTDRYQAIAIGPGLGQEEDTALAMMEQIQGCPVPLVLDADAINIFGTHRNWLSRMPKRCILTPHLKELERLIGKCMDTYERLTKTKELAAYLQSYIIIKGSWSTVVTPEGNCYFNPTGNPGMATAGSGDVLTGILAALLAQGYTQEDACRLGVYVHGLAGDIAAEEKGEIGTTSSDLIDALPAAWKKLTETKGRFTKE